MSISIYVYDIGIRMSDFDLDINNYSIKDLETFFGLKKKCTEDDIEFKEYEIRERLLSSGNINRRFQRDLIEFLAKAKEWLIYSKFGKKPAPSEIPKDWKLDKEDVPKLGELTHRQSNIVTHPPHQYINANNNEFYAGYLNPLNIRMISKYVTIDTRFCDKLAKPSDFTLQLPTRLNKVVSIQLSSLELPIMFNNISSVFGNNFFYVLVKQQLTPSDPIIPYEKVLLIPDGNYTDISLVNKINDLLCPTDASGNIIHTSSIFSYVVIGLDEGYGTNETKRVTIHPNTAYLTAATIVEIQLDFSKNSSGISDTTNINTRIGFNLGFTQTKYTNMTTYVGDVAMNMNTIRYLYLSLNDYQRSTNKLFLSAYDEMNLGDNILARISIKSPILSTLTENDYNLITEPRIYFGPVDVQKLHVQIFDDFGRILNMSNINYSFVLLFKMVYDL